MGGVRGVLVQVGLFLAVVLAIPAAAGGASSGTVACGQVLTEDTTVRRNLIDCPGDGLIIGAVGVTLDLNGHSVRGSGSGVGVRIDADDATIMDGKVSGFAVGVGAFPSGPVFHLQSLKIIQNGTGIQAAHMFNSSGEATIESSEIARNSGRGLDFNFYRLTVTHSKIRKNGADGIYANETIGI